MIEARLQTYLAALIVAGLAALLTAPALAFDYARYKTADLDELLAQPRLKTDAAWQARYGNAPSMDWSRYDPVNPQSFDADVFAGRPRKP